MDAIKAQSEQEAVLTLKADLKVPTQDYKAYFGVAGKHIIVKSDGLLHKLYFPNVRPENLIFNNLCKVSLKQQFLCYSGTVRFTSPYVILMMYL